MSNVDAKTQEYNQLRMKTLLDTVTAQRNDAQNACANLTADKAVLEQALRDTIEANRAQLIQLGETKQQVVDLQAALAEAHEALASLKKPVEVAASPAESETGSESA